MENRTLKDVMNQLGTAAKEALESLEEIILSGLQEEDLPEYKRMMYLPDGSVFFLDREESDGMMSEYDEMGIIPLPEAGLYLVFDEDHVVELDGRRYVSGPVLVRTDLDPDQESDLTREELRFVFDRLEENEETVPFGGIGIPVLALG